MDDSPPNSQEQSEEQLKDELVGLIDEALPRLTKQSEQNYQTESVREMVDVVMSQATSSDVAGQKMTEFIEFAISRVSSDAFHGVSLAVCKGLVSTMKAELQKISNKVTTLMKGVAKLNSFKMRALEKETAFA